MNMVYEDSIQHPSTMTNNDQSSSLPQTSSSSQHHQQQQESFTIQSLYRNNYNSYNNDGHTYNEYNHNNPYRTINNNNNKYQVLYEISIRIHHIMNTISYYDMIYIGFIQPMIIGIIIITILCIIIRFIIKPLFYPQTIIHIHCNAIQLLLSGNSTSSNNNINYNNNFEDEVNNQIIINKKKKKKLPSFSLSFLLYDQSERQTEKGILLLKQLSYNERYIPAIISLAAYYVYVSYQPNEAITLLSSLLDQTLFQSLCNNNNNSLLLFNNNFNNQTTNINDYTYYTNMFHQSIRNILCDAKAMMIICPDNNKNCNNDYNTTTINDSMMMIQTLLRYDEYLSIQYAKEFTKLIQYMYKQEQKQQKKKKQQQNEQQNNLNSNKGMTIRQILFLSATHNNNNLTTTTMTARKDRTTTVTATTKLGKNNNAKKIESGRDAINDRLHPGKRIHKLSDAPQLSHLRREQENSNELQSDNTSQAKRPRRISNDDEAFGSTSSFYDAFGRTVKLHGQTSVNQKVADQYLYERDYAKWNDDVNPIWSLPKSMSMDRVFNRSPKRPQIPRYRDKMFCVPYLVGGYCIMGRRCRDLHVDPRSVGRDGSFDSFCRVLFSNAK